MIRDIITAALSIAKAEPEFVYSQPDPDSDRCFYVHGGEPSCIFGRALVLTGVPVGTVAQIEKDLSEADGDTSLNRMLKALEITVPEPAMAQLAAVQTMQDRGARYGELIPRLTAALQSC